MLILGDLILELLPKYGGFMEKIPLNLVTFAHFFFHKSLCLLPSVVLFYFFGCDVADMVIIHKMI